MLRSTQVFAPALLAALMLAACGGKPDHAHGVEAAAPAVAAAPQRAAASDRVSATGMWVRALPPGAAVSAGYFTLHNPTDAPLRLVAVESPAAGRVEIHEMRHEGGMMQMRPLEAGLEVPPRGQAQLKPGGTHLMFFEVEAERFSEGAELPLTLVLASGERLEVTAAVRASPPAAEGDHSGHH
jgi:copper(I)-binding protein